MTSITDQGATAWRDYVTDGVPSSGARHTPKSDARAVMAAIDLQKAESIDTLADFEAFESAPNTVLIKGHTAAHDGWGGVFVKVVGSVTAADDVLVIRRTAGGDSYKRLCEYGVVLNSWFRTTGDGTTDDTEAMQAAVTFAKTYGYVLRIIPGSYRLTDEVDCLQTDGTNWAIRGDDWNLCIIITDFTGLDKAAFKFRNANRDKMRGNLHISGLRFQASVATRQSPNPTFIDMDGPAQMVMENIRLDRCNNTILRLNSANNVKLSNIMNFNGGRSWLYKPVGVLATPDKSGITVTMAIGSLTVSVTDPSDPAIFSADLVGRKCFIDDNVRGGKFFTITAVAGDERSCTATTGDDEAETDFEGVISFGHARVAMTAASNLVTFDCNCLTTDDDGVYVYIQDANTDGGLLYGYLEYVTASTANLMYIPADAAGVAAAKNAVESTPGGGSLIGVPAIDFSREDMYNTANGLLWEGYASDVMVERLTTESTWGIQIAVNKAVQFFMNQSKMHSDAVLVDTATTPGNYVGQTIANMWLHQCVGGIDQTQFVANPSGGQGHVYGAWMAGQFYFRDNNWNLSYGDNIMTYRKPNTPSNETGSVVFSIGATSRFGEDVVGDKLFLGDTDSILLDGPANEARGAADKKWNWTSPQQIWHPTSEDRQRLRHITDAAKYWDVGWSTDAWRIGFSGDDRLTIASTDAATVTITAAGAAADVDLDLDGKGTGVPRIAGSPVATRGATENLTNKTLVRAELSQYLTKGIYILDSSAVAASHTGDTSETILATVAVPADVMGLDGSIRISSLWSFTNSGNTKTIRERFGGIGGTAYTALPFTTTNVLSHVTRFQNRGAANSQVGGSATSNAGLGATGLGAVNVTSAIDTTSSQDIVFTAQLASAGETITLESYLVELILP